jgi:hypothetical protein
MGINELDRVMKPYFDGKFSTLDIYYRENKYGFWDKKNKQIILGEYNVAGTWFYHLPHFTGGQSLFDLTFDSFTNAIHRYVREYYPELKVYEII